MRGELKALVEETGKQSKEGGALSSSTTGSPLSEAVFYTHHHPFEDETQSFQLYMAPMHGKGDDGDVCDKIDVGAFDIGLEIFSKLSVET